MANTPNYRVLRLNSDDRVNDGNDSPTKFTVNFRDGKVQNARYFTLKSVTIPNMFYNVDSRFNNIIFVSAALGPLTITLAIGQYNINEFMAEIQLQLNTLVVATATTYTVTLVPITNVIRITRTAGVDNITFDPHLLMGISQTLAIGAQADAHDPPRLSGVQMIYLHCKQLALGKSVLSGDIHVSSFAEIGINVPFGTIQTYQANDEMDKIIFPANANLGGLDIRIRSHDGTVLAMPSNQTVLISLKAWY